MHQAWLLFFYTSLALRENILRVNGSDIRPWYALISLNLRMPSSSFCGYCEYWCSEKCIDLTGGCIITIVRCWWPSWVLRGEFKVILLASASRYVSALSIFYLIHLCGTMFAVSSKFLSSQVRSKVIVPSSSKKVKFQYLWNSRCFFWQYMSFCYDPQQGVRLFLGWAVMQGVAMLLQNRYQRQRLYTRIALGKVLHVVSFLLLSNAQYSRRIS